MAIMTDIETELERIAYMVVKASQGGTITTSVRSVCGICAHAAERHRWPMAAGTHCRDCDRSWTSTAQAHCIVARQRRGQQYSIEEIAERIRAATEEAP